LVQESAYAAFVDKFVAAIEASTVGDPLDPQVMFGPVISHAAADRMLGVIEDAIAEGSGDLIVGDRRLGRELAALRWPNKTFRTGRRGAARIPASEEHPHRHAVKMMSNVSEEAQWPAG
jgi:acyl-CoA reductase-like NAD-dependent aldehyde dehydrogenase